MPRSTRKLTRLRLALTALVLAPFALLLTACPGPGGTLTQSVVITSHTDGQVISGSRVISLMATLVNMPDVGSYTVTLNGVAETATRSGSVITADIELHDHANKVAVEATSTAGNTVYAEVNLEYPFVTLGTYQAAAFAIGQDDLVSVTEATPRKMIDGPSGRPSALGGHLYLPDEELNRVLGYGVVPSSSGASPDFVLGQDQFDDTSGREGATGLHAPAGTATDGVRLAVADGNNSRVLVWNAAPTAQAAPADLVLGQGDFLNNVPGCAATKVDHPAGVAFVGNKLAVADTDNNRVLIWSLPTADGAAADVVIGQASFTTCANNDDDQDGAAEPSPTARTLSGPLDVWSDGQRLYVADSLNNRVLVYDSLPTTNFAAADRVLGQTSFTALAPNTGASGLDYPSSVHGNVNQLFVADSGNNRVLVWQSVPAANGADADLVLGQTNFDNTTANAGSLDPTANGLGFPTGVYQTGDLLIVGDYENNRYVVYGGVSVP
ncbi:MAG: hypothetical protein KF875_12945 [Trueperaceae bacterium]|nr:hypothetical protein [Trueperaceae bacterium]MCO5174868.1 hypothetical protein [Trueperaceae bacterium]